MYKVVLSGVKSHTARSEASKNLSILFKTSTEQVDHLLEMPRKVIKGGLSLEVATEYRNAIEAAGAICKIERETLDVDLPPSPTFLSERTDAEHINKSDSLSIAWQKRFELIKKAGGPALSWQPYKAVKNLNTLAFSERRALFNVFALLFGPLYYIFKGLWKKAVLLTLTYAIAVILASRLEQLYEIEMPLIYWNTFSILIASHFAAYANVDYFDLKVNGKDFWAPVSQFIGRFLLLTVMFIVLILAIPAKVMWDAKAGLNASLIDSPPDEQSIASPMDRPNFNNETRALLSQAEQWTSNCRGGSGDLPSTWEACKKRDKIYSELELRGVCWGPAEVDGAHKSWVKCQ